MKYFKYIISKIYRFFCFYLKLFKKTSIDYNQAQKSVKNIWYKQCPEFFQENSIEDLNDLMIIVPVYNTDKYIKKCINSVLDQKTKYQYHIVIVNDGSTDNSSAVLQTYQQHKNITIINQTNMGLSGARNTALKHINAKYVMFLDSDDYLSENSIELLMRSAYENNADLVAGGYALFDDKGIIEESIFNLDQQANSVYDVPGFACMKVFKSDLLKNFCFPQGFLYEDTIISMLLYDQCKTVCVVPTIIYYYRNNVNSISNSYYKDVKSIDTYWITRYCYEESKKRGIILDNIYCEQYLKQCYVNFLRTRFLPRNIQEYLFVLTENLFQNEWKYEVFFKERKFRWLKKAIDKNSFDAYLFVLERWDLIS